jgi:hypothetical protein
MRLIDRFQLTIGRAVNELNKFQLDEDEQIRLSRQYALQILGQLLLLLLGLTAVVALAGSPFLALDRLFRPLAGYSTAALTGGIVGGVALASLAYGWFQRWRRRRAPQADKTTYGASKKLFYYLVLGAPVTGKSLHKLERLFARPLRQVPQGLIVTGLARAGTTTLLRYLHAHPRLRSLTYRHMPFLLGARPWLALNRSAAQQTERSHRDGIMVDLDSPEAFDEYFWRIIRREDYYQPAQHPHQLVRHELNEAQIQQYERYVAARLRPGEIYLTKNNNLILRLASFLRQRPNYLAVIVFREPLGHAESLLRQQRLQAEEQRNDPFVLAYMDWLGHNEFGLNRLDFNLQGTAYQYSDPLTIDYWLERWVDYYSYALQLQYPNLCFVSNEQIATRPQRVVDTILARFGLAYQGDWPTQPPKAAQTSDYDAALYEQACGLYEQLRRREGELLPVTTS